MLSSKSHEAYLYEPHLPHHQPSIPSRRPPMSAERVSPEPERARATPTRPSQPEPGEGVRRWRYLSAVDAARAVNTRQGA